MSESTIFSNAHDFHIDTINHYGVTPGRPPLDRLLERVSHGAIHDSAERGRDAPKCHPETRVAVQQEIVSWIKHGDRDAHPARILWLSGPAGSGKTAIAGTVAEECHREGLLAASFFFSGFSQSLDRRLRGYFVATLAYQLLQHRSLPPIRDTVLSVIEGDPAILHKNLDEQIEQLILRPLRVAAGRGPKGRWPTVILVDGLDECDVHPDQRFETKQDRQSAKEDVHREILTALIRATSDPSFPFRIIIASRPEPAIHSVISSTQMVRNVFLDDKYTPEKDIETFVRAMLTKVGRDYGLRPNWFAQHIPRTLAQRSSGQFIYATTALRFIQDRTRPPHEQLKRVLGWTQFDASEGNPFAALDALYARILKTSPNPSLAAKWISATNGRSDATIVAIFPDQFKKALLESFPGETQYLLGSLTSLICTNPNEGQIFSLYHQTLVDFLGDRGRSGDLHVSKADVVKFNKDCCHSILKNRGPVEGTISRPSDLADFIHLFCKDMALFIDPSRELHYDPGDVDWWWANVFPAHREARVLDVFIKVHRKCRSFHCHPACKVWRKTLLEHCRADSWPRLPKKTEMLRDRFKKYEYATAADFPLRGPTQSRKLVHREQ